jgi:hypothetical protein
VVFKNKINIISEILLLEENGVPEKVFRDRITKKCMQFHVSSSPKQTKCNAYVMTS